MYASTIKIPFGPRVGSPLPRMDGSAFGVVKPLRTSSFRYRIPDGCALPPELPPPRTKPPMWRPAWILLYDPPLPRAHISRPTRALLVVYGTGTPALQPAHPPVWCRSGILLCRPHPSTIPPRRSSAAAWSLSLDLPSFSRPAPPAQLATPWAGTPPPSLSALLWAWGLGGCGGSIFCPVASLCILYGHHYPRAHPSSATSLQGRRGSHAHRFIPSFSILFGQY